MVMVTVIDVDMELDGDARDGMLVTFRLLLHDGGGPLLNGIACIRTASCCGHVCRLFLPLPMTW